MDSSALYSSSIQSGGDVGGQTSLKLRQKIAELELALANQTSSSNKEIMGLEERIAKLRASFEKNELVRRKVEYELAAARKDLNHEIRNKKQEGEVKKKELGVCKDELSVKSKELKSMETLLQDKVNLFEKERESLVNEIKSQKDDNADLRTESNDLKKKLEELSKKCSVAAVQLNTKNVEIEYTEKMLKDHNLIFEKEKEDLTTEVKELKSINNAELRIENEKNSLNARKSFDEINNKYKKLDDEHSKMIFELKSTESSLHNQKMLFDKENETLMKEITDLKQANDKIIINWKKKNGELNEKCSLLESQRIEHTATIHKLVNDNKSICNNEQEWMEKNKDLQTRIKTLTENIEAERATHLETKFNTELLELKLRDLGNELAAERDCLKVCTNNIEEAEKKCRRMESVIVNEKELKETLDKKNLQLESKYELQSKELTDKSVALSNINLEVDKLKEELTEAKSKMFSIESNKNEIIKDLKFLLINYVDKSTNDYLPDQWTLKTIVEMLKPILKDSGARVKESKQNLEVARSSLEKMTVELEAQQKDVASRDKALEEAERLVKNAQYHYSTSELKCSDYEKHMKMLEEENSHLSSETAQKEEEIKILMNDVSKAKLATEQNIESTYASLQIMYDLLITGAVQPAYPITHSMNELKDAIIDKLKQNIHNERLKEEEIDKLHIEIERLTEKLLNHKQANKKLRKVNAELLSQTGKRVEDAEKEKHLLEEQLNTKLDEYKVACSGMEIDRNDAMAKCTSIAKSLKETELLNENISKTLQQYKHENKYLITAIAIITGGLWGLILRHQSLCVEKSILVNIVRQLFKLKGDMLELTDTVHIGTTEKCADASKSTRGLRGIFRFRIVVIAVLGVIRFYKVAAYTRTINSKQKSCSCHNNLLFYGTSLEGKVSSNGANKENELSAWLQNNDILKNACLDAVAPLLSLKKCSANPRHDKSVSHDNLVETVCTCYTRYLDSVKVEMERSTLFSLKFRGKKNSLIHHLGLGLKRLLDKEKNVQILYTPVVKITSNLHKSIIELINKHHSSEKERMSLISNCERYKEERNLLKSQISTHIAQLAETEKTLKAHVCDLEKEIENAISEDQFNEVCANLDDALKREQNLQILLNEQKKEIFEITSKIEKQEECYQKSVELFSVDFKSHQEDVQCLQSKMGELKDKLLKLEEEKEELNILLEKEHRDMEQFCLERELFLQYIKKVISVLQRNNKSIDLSHLNKLNKLQETVLPEKVLALDGKTVTPEMQACQNSVISLVDLYKGTLHHIVNLTKEKQHLYGKITSLEDDAKTHRLNVQKLKNQISALCQEDTLDTMQSTCAKETSSPIFVPLKGNCNAHF